MVKRLAILLDQVLGLQSKRRKSGGTVSRGVRRDCTSAERREAAVRKREARKLNAAKPEQPSQLEAKPQKERRRQEALALVQLRQIEVSRQREDRRRIVETSNKAKPVSSDIRSVGAPRNPGCARVKRRCRCGHQAMQNSDKCYQCGDK